MCVPAHVHVVRTYADMAVGVGVHTFCHKFMRVCTPDFVVLTLTDD